MERETPQPEKSVEEEIAKRYRDWWPGKMGWAAGSTASGCAVKSFMHDSFEEADTLLNNWFSANSGMQVVSLQPSTTKSGQCGYIVIYTKTVSPEQMAQYDRVEAKAMELIAKEDEEAAIQKAALEELNMKAEKERAEQAKKDEKEKNRLAELGRVHEKNCKKGKK